MIEKNSMKKRKLIDKIIGQAKIKEIKFYNELLEMANIGPKATGLDNIVIWVGPNPDNDIIRIKVCNQPNQPNNYIDTFSITIPDLEIVGKVNEKFITT